MALACAVEPSAFRLPLKQLTPEALPPPLPFPLAGLVLPPVVPPELLHAASASAPASSPAAIPARLSFTMWIPFVVKTSWWVPSIRTVGAASGVTAQHW
jgi:hypothetical protein